VGARPLLQRQSGHRVDAPVSTTDAAGRVPGDVSRLHVVAPVQSDPRELETQLIEDHVAVARSIASRYRDRGIDLDDLEQVALLALIRAARRFDPDAGHDFMSYAVPTIRGELRKHFRDSGWMVRPPRRVQELQARIPRAQEELERRLGRSPRPSEISAHLGEDLDVVVEALTADGCFTPASLDAPVGDRSAVLGDLLGHTDPDLDAAEARALLAPVLRRLDDRDRLMLTLRFAEQRTQTEIGERVGLTQTQVSRVLARILRQLRAELG
jgi:RNA polymerase sigma-B factor